jgi:DNA-binding transcriptional ArsR family regulator
MPPATSFRINLGQHEQASQAVFPDEVGGLIMNAQPPSDSPEPNERPEPIEQLGSNENLGPNEPLEEDTALTAMALKAMAHPLRWKILCSLGKHELSVGEIVERTGTSQSNISQHLEQLRNKNIVVARKEANRIYYRIRNHQLLELIGIMRDVLCPANLDDRYPR